MLEVMRDMLEPRYLRSKSCAQTISANVLKTKLVFPKHRTREYCVKEHLSS